MVSEELIKRIKTAAVLVVVVAIALYFGGKVILALSLLVYLAINFEFYTFALPGRPVLRTYFTLSSLALPILALVGVSQGIYAATLVISLISILFIIFLYEKEAHQPEIRDLLSPFAIGLIYPGIVGTSFVLAAHLFSSLNLAWVILGVAILDSGAYFVGRAVGGAKLAPRTSPKKTISGAIGGSLLAVTTMVITATVFKIPASIPMQVFVSLLICILAIGGDLAESLIKRMYGVKDSGFILPGHGGVLDRIDALLFAIPCLFLFGSS